MKKIKTLDEESIVVVETPHKPSKKTRRGNKNKNNLNKLTILYQNVRGLKSKLPSLQVIVAEHNPSFICITETHLSEDDPGENSDIRILEEGDQNTISFEGYTTLRNDRDALGGGCLLAFKKEMTSLITEVDVICNNHESLWIKVGNHIAKLKIGVIYMPSENVKKHIIEEAYKEIENEVRNINDNEDIIICGDFNAKLKMDQQEQSDAGVIMHNFISKNKLNAINLTDKCSGIWTRVEKDSKSVIDYVLTTSDSIIKKMIVDEDRSFSVQYLKKEKNIMRTIYSDHNAIWISVFWKNVISRNMDEKSYVMTKNGLQKYNMEIQNLQLSKSINEHNDVNKEYSNWERKVTEIYKKQMKSVKKKGPWKVNRKLIQIIKSIKRKIKKGILNPDEIDMAKKRISLIKIHCEEEIRLRCKMTVKNVIEQVKESGRTNMDPFWKYNKKRKTDNQIGVTIRKESGERIEDKEEILKEYEKHYQNLLGSNEATSEIGKQTEKIVEDAINALKVISRLEPKKKITTEEVQLQIKTLKKKKAADTKGWVNEYLIHGGSDLAECIQILINMMTDQNKIPDSWSQMWIKSIFKDNRIKKLNKTRGLFMTNIVSKLQEKIIKARNRDKWEASTSPFQCGGKKGVSTIDHTMTVLEMIHRNKYLNKSTYLICIDMEKCFDKLWLESGVIELWKSGMNVVDANTLLNMNRKADVIVDSPVGKTNMFTVNNVVKQGTIYGPAICSKEMECVNTSCHKTVSYYGPHIEIESLAYVDDLIAAITKALSKTVLANIGNLEDKKKMIVNMIKSNYMVVHKKKNENTDLDATINQKKVKQTCEQEYLGTWINDKASCQFNINKRIEKCNGVTKKIEEMTCVSRVGNLSTSLKIELYPIILISVLMFNMSAWGKWSQADEKSLERFQGQTLRRLLKVPKTTPYLGILWETGIWRVSDELIYKQLMLLHNIMQSGDERILKRIIIEQNRNPIPNCWLECVKQRAKDVGIDVNVWEISKKKKPAFKKQIKDQIRANFVDYVLKNKTTKLRTVLKKPFMKRKFIVDGMLSPEEIRTILMTRLHMLKVKCNYKKSDSMLCQFCGKENETTEHLFECSRIGYLKTDLRMEELKLDEDNSADARNVFKFVSRVEKIMIEHN